MNAVTAISGCITIFCFVNSNLLSPSPIESHKLLLRSHSIIEDAQDVLLSAYPLQPLDSFEPDSSNGLGSKTSGFSPSVFPDRL